MKKFIFLLVLVFAQAAAQDVRLAREVVDFGVVPMKPRSQQSVMLYNKGIKPMVIMAVNVDCNCTKVEWSKKPVMAGDSTLLKINYDPSDKGVFYKKIRVKTSQGENTITIKGRVE
ncbi:hypothetical protein BN938_0145 [Mucinivorans hirudinis]|uniref:DUF1573 domain-containing protein n=1 Tax=Mucinivorans hirudinis TaxID=1433126 RepID=A0A060R5T0_9BACT|nr:hypothetical protein BN938_0145 [Mucinivorans hirudinis]